MSCMRFKDPEIKAINQYLKDRYRLSSSFPSDATCQEPKAWDASEACRAGRDAGCVADSNWKGSSTMRVHAALLLGMCMRGV